MSPLKALLDTHRIVHSKLAMAVGLSKTALSLLVTRGRWPAKKNSDTLIREITAYLVEQGVPEESVRDIFTQKNAGKGSTPNRPTSKRMKEMLLQRQALTQAARNHFGLGRDPFFNEINGRDDVFIGQDARNVREAMKQTVRLGGFLAVVGESGAGKSTLRMELLDEIQRSNAPYIVIEPYVLGIEDSDKRGSILKANGIMDAVIRGISPQVTVRIGDQARQRQLHELLVASAESGMRHMLLIEEAHCLTRATLKHLKRFSELTHGFQKLLAICLIGQPELAAKLTPADPSIREVVQRCEVVALPPLGNHLGEYIAHKFARAGRKWNELLSQEAIERIAQCLVVVMQRGDRNRSDITKSLAYPLMVNNVLAAALNRAAAVGAPVADAKIVDYVFQGE